MTKKKRNCIVGGVLTVALFISAFIMMLGILDAVTEINDTLIREDAESILAEAGIKNEDKVSLSVAYYDENNKGYVGILEMQYQADGAEFSFYKDEFYPLGKKAKEGESEDKKEEADSKDISVENKDLLKMDFALPFMAIADGREYFEIEADDETLVYIGDELVLGMDGVSEARNGRFKINKSGEVYTSIGGEDFAYSGVNVAKGEGELVKILHVDKDAANGSKFNLVTRGMNLTVSNTSVANKKSDKMKIAYDPMDETYAQPLGETKAFNRNNSRQLSVLVIIEGAVVVVFAVAVVLGAKYIV